MKRRWQTIIGLILILIGSVTLIYIYEPARAQTGHPLALDGDLTASHITLVPAWDPPRARLMFKESGVNKAAINGTTTAPQSMEFSIEDRERAVLKSCGKTCIGYNATGYYAVGARDFAKNHDPPGYRFVYNTFGTISGGSLNRAATYGQVLGGYKADGGRYQIATGSHVSGYWEVLSMNSGAVMGDGDTIDELFSAYTTGQRFATGNGVNPNHGASFTLTDSWKKVGLDSYTSFPYAIIMRDESIKPTLWYYIDADVILAGDNEGNEIGAYQVSGVFSCIDISGAYPISFARSTTTLYEDDPSWDAEINIQGAGTICEVYIGVIDTDDAGKSVEATVSYHINVLPDHESEGPSE